MGDRLSRWGASLWIAVALIASACGGGGSDGGSSGGPSANDGGGPGVDGSGPSGGDGGTSSPSNVAWSKVLLGADVVSPNFVGISSAGEVYVSMQFSGHADFGVAAFDADDTTDIAIVKLTAAREVAWAARISATDPGGQTAENLGSVVVDPNGDVYVAGDFEGETLDVAGTAVTGRVVTDKGESDGYIARLDGATGKAKWAKSFTMTSGAENREAVCSVSQLSSASASALAFGCAVEYGTVSFSGGTATVANRSVIAGEIDTATGDVSWFAEVGAPFGGSVAAGSTLAGDVVLLDLYTSPSEVGVVSKQTKTVMFTKSLSVTAYELRVAPDGDIVVGGMTSPSSGSSTEAAVLRLSADGTEKWRKVFGGPSQDTVNALAVDADGSVLVTGTTDPEKGPTSVDNHPLLSDRRGFYIVRLDGTSGAVKSASGWSGTDNFFLRTEGIAAAPGGILVAGHFDHALELDQPYEVGDDARPFVALFKQ